MRSRKAKNQLSELLSKPQGGEDFAITPHGQPVARLPRRADGPAAAGCRRIFSALARLRTGTSGGREGTEPVSKLTHEGHRW